jgi:hypothetical protein
LQVPPLGTMPIPGVSGTVVGFAFAREAAQYPAFVVTSDSVLTDDRRSYMVVPAQLIDRPATTVAAADVAGRIAGVRVDNSYVDWLQVEPIVSVPSQRAPLGVFRESGDGRYTATLSEATLWERGGTDLEAVKSATRGTQLFLYFAARSEVSQARSVFLYLREPDRSVGTIEITGGSPAGLVLYWPVGSRRPEIVGSAVNARFFTEAALSLEALADLLGAAEATVEIATGLRDGGMWEEFVISEVTVGQLLGE